jgi:large subunit ribosomal protein L28
MPGKKRRIDTNREDEELVMDDEHERDINLGEPDSDSQSKIEITRASYEKLHHDPYWRTLNNPDKTSSAFIFKSKAGQVIARQYFPPADEDAGTCSGDDLTPKEADADDSSRPRKTVISAFRPISSMRQVEPFPGVERYRAVTPKGTELIGRRSLQMKATTEEGDVTGRLYTFSPVPKGDVWWGAPGEPEHIIKDLKGEDLEEVMQDMREAGANVKGGAELDVDLASVAYRKSIKNRRPDQNTVMGDSAKNATEAFLEQFEDILDEKVIKKLRQSIEAPLRGLFKSNYRPEWLHLYGFGLTPKKLQPQTELNLGAAPKWCNTEMMIAEYIGQFLAELASEEGIDTVNVKILPVFHMFFDSDIVRHIEFKMKVEMGEREVEIEQQINPLGNALFKKKVDVAVGSVAVAKILNGEEPDREIEVDIHRKGIVASNESMIKKLKSRASRRRRSSAMSEDEHDREVVEGGLEAMELANPRGSLISRDRVRTTDASAREESLASRRREAESEVRRVRKRSRVVIASDTESDEGDEIEVQEVQEHAPKRRRSSRLRR